MFVRVCWCVMFICHCLHACYSKAERGVDSFMSTVWSGLCRNQAHAADNGMITHTHAHTHSWSHTIINCAKELQNYKEASLPLCFFISVLYAGISFVLFCNSGGFSQPDIPSPSFVMLIWGKYSVVLTLLSDWLSKCFSCFCLGGCVGNVPDMNADYLIWPPWIKLLPSCFFLTCRLNRAALFLLLQKVWVNKPPWQPGLWHPFIPLVYFPKFKEETASFHTLLGSVIFSPHR